MRKARVNFMIIIHFKFCLFQVCVLFFSSAEKLWQKMFLIIETVSRRKRSTCTSISIKPGCAPDVTESEDGVFSLATDDCFTPKITSISLKQGYMDSEITITGRNVEQLNQVVR